MNSTKRWMLTILSVALISIILSACNSNSTDQDQDKKEEIVFGNDQWDSLTFNNEVARFIIENGYGNPTDEITGSSSAVYQGMQQEQIDVHMETWVKNVAVYEEGIEEGIEEGYLNKLGINFSDNRQGFYVPTYVIEGDSDRGIEAMAPDLEYVADLSEYPEVFMDPSDSSKGLIVGSVAGWTVDDVMHEAYEQLGLDEQYNYISPGSEAALNTSLMSAYEDGEPWVGFVYEPTWISGKYDLTFLKIKHDDSPLHEIKSQDVVIVVNETFEDKHPEIAEFLGNYQVTSEILNNVLVDLQEDDVSVQDTAVKFLQEQEDVWSEWVTDEVKDKVKDALEDE